MKSVSYCTTCKGRLWQLKQTLPTNLKETNEKCSIVLLDYHSEDGLQEYISSNYRSFLDDGRLKYYKLLTPVDGFDMAFAKHIVHTLSHSDVLFNLDADNYIGSTLNELATLPLGEMLIPKIVKGTHSSRCGRIGFNKTDYLKINGYDINLHGMASDDGNIVRRAYQAGIRFKFSEDLSIPVPQSHEDKFKFIRKGNYILPDYAEVVDYQGTRFIVDLRNHNIQDTIGEI